MLKFHAISNLKYFLKYENFISARNTYFLDVRNSYYDLYEISQNLRISEENLEILTAWEKLAVKKFEGGLAGMVDVLRVQMMMQELETSIEELRQEWQDRKEIFNLLLNRNMEEEVNIDLKLNFPEQEYEVYSDSLIRNPAIVTLNARRIAEERLLELDASINRPNIGIGIDYVAVGPSAVDIPDSGKDAWMPMVSLSLPIYGKKNKSRIQERELNIEALDLYKSDLENRLQSELKQGMNDYEDSKRDFDLYTDLIEKADQTLRVLVADYTSASRDSEEVLRMQQMLLRYELSLEKSIVQRYKAEAQLDFIFNY